MVFNVTRESNVPSWRERGVINVKKLQEENKPVKQILVISKK